MVGIWLFIKSNKKLVISVAVLLALFSYGAILSLKLRNANERVKALTYEAQADSILILTLTRDKIDLTNDTAKYRSEIRLIGEDVKKLRQSDEVKDLVKKYPSLEDLKRK